MDARKLLSWSLWVVVGLLAGGCETDQKHLDSLPSQEFTGYYSEGVGRSWFRPADAPVDGPAWWVTFTGQAVYQVQQAREAGKLLAGQPYFVRWQAAITKGGEIGPRGKGEPALLVREILELKPAEAGK
jgi:hypothetical protein